MSSLLSTPALRDLQKGCDILGKPTDLALELVRFLIVNRWHSLAPYGMALSPGVDVEELWHWMLLNTEVAKRVHELVGGVVEHCYPDGGDGPADEEARMLRRLKAMTLMQQEGWMPQVQFWQEPGTLLDGLQLVRRVTVSGLAPPIPLWTSIHTTPQQLHVLAQDLRMQQPAPETLGAEARHQSLTDAPQPAAAPNRASPAAPPAAAAWVPGVGQAHSPRQQAAEADSRAAFVGGSSSQSGQASFALRVMSPKGELQVQGQPHMLVEWLKAVVTHMTDIPPEQQRLISSGRQLEEGLSLQHYGLQAGSVVHLVVRVRM